MRKVDKDFAEDWWFQVWGPDKLTRDGIGKQADWVLGARSKWHGFGSLAAGFNMLDPIKCTLITPGLGLDGRFAKTGIPASILTKFLAEHGVVVEKTGLYSFFILFTIGITKGRWNTLLTALQQFKDDYDKNAQMWRILPEFCAKFPMYEGMGLRDLSQAIHETYAKGDIARLVTEMYLSDLHPAMKPSDAFAMIARRQTERVEIAADPVPARHPAADPGGTVQPQDRAIPEVHARVQCRLPGFRHRRARPGRGRRRGRRAAPVLRGLRQGRVISLPGC
jgi:arginine/lysine/ornithine decarboxylase